MYTSSLVLSVRLQKRMMYEGEGSLFLVESAILSAQIMILRAERIFDTIMSNLSLIFYS